jgi:hypothetical protein
MLFHRIEQKRDILALKWSERVKGVKEMVLVAIKGKKKQNRIRT